MNEILKGARYTFGGLVVFTLWLMFVGKYAELRWQHHLDSQVAQQVEYENSLLEFGPGAYSSKDERRRYNELIDTGK